jgi:hypothetical protein
MIDPEVEALESMSDYPVFIDHDPADRHTPEVMTVL